MDEQEFNLKCNEISKILQTIFITRGYKTIHCTTAMLTLTAQAYLFFFKEDKENFLKTCEEIWNQIEKYGNNNHE